MFNQAMEFIRNIQNKRKNSLKHDIDVYENFEKLYFFDSEKLYELIYETEAFKLYADLEDIEYIIERMKKYISKFQEKAEEFLVEAKKEYEEDFIEISYIFTSYTFTLLNIRTAIQKNNPVNYYEEKTKEIFSVDLVGSLIKVIRNTSVHRNLYKPKWNIEYKLPGKEIYIILDKKLLLKDHNLNSKDKKLIKENYGEHINIIQLFEQYMQKIELLHKWHKKEIYKTYPEKIEQYKKYIEWLDILMYKNCKRLLVLPPLS
ncbi:hypothetical protein [Sulfurimonas sp.]|uniref:hypothetical protein n=1 Tax=Sulfurimonas sp. TaxID=2022749 RepID=UPI0025DB3A8F|nr:hypothetical protein [Sulfurimonas sp.]MCK9455361.1 hypothetical protein [Sulfurimonas sp.]